jgi:hypothetical protein
MHPEIEKLINLTIASGQVTEKNRATILRKAEKLGEDKDEVELILDGELALLKQDNNIQNNQVSYTNNKELVNISFLQAASSFINKYKFLKYAIIFFLICLGFNLLIFILL